MTFAGIWEGWRGPGGELLHCTFPTITTAASENIRPIHYRMPAILELGECEFWPGETDGDPERLLRPREDLPLTSQSPRSSPFAGAPSNRQMYEYADCRGRR